jgi:hypothetical protein
MSVVLACRLCDVEFAGADRQAAQVERTAHLRREHLQGRKDRSLDRWLNAQGVPR